MENLLTVAFEAHNQERNHHRRYEVKVGRDLLGDWTVAIRYGRTGQAGRQIRYAAAEADALRDVIRVRLQRRLTALRRIGCLYRQVTLDSAPGFDALTW